MANSSILGGERAPLHASGRGADLLGPSDSSDSGSDSIGELGPDQIDSDTDRYGTGERASADLGESGSGLDILPDHVARASRGGPGEIELDVEQLAAEEDDDSGDGDEGGGASDGS